MKTKEVKKIYFIVIYTIELQMRERHFSNQAEAETFAATVNGSVCPMI